MPVDYNKTINLPKTDFPMRAGLPKREPGFLEEWKEDGVFEELLKINADKPKYVLHDGPPFSNGNIHMGTALNKVLKDFINRYKAMSGYYTPYKPGWDNHGMPIESAIIKAHRLDRNKMTIPEFRDRCREFAQSFVDIQMEQFIRLGVLGDWENPYLTMTPEFEKEEVKVFGEMYRKGYIYKGLKPVYWCSHDETALAEAEIEYFDDPVESIYVKFQVTDDLGRFAGISDIEKLYFVIWTTTAWSLPGNLAIALNPSEEYALARIPSGETFIMAKALIDKVMNFAGYDEYEIIHTFEGKQAEGMKARHPFLDRESLLVLADYVTMDSGTGCVHTAPAHGIEDYESGRKYNLPEITPIDDRGYMTAEAGQFEGLFYEKAADAITEHLRETGALFADEKLVHSYPHCWRCKEPVIYRATSQWFCSVEAIKDEAVAACRAVKWIPAWGEERIISMIRDRADWCISRQRTWGVPIPFFVHKDTNELHPRTPELIEDVAKLIEQEGIDGWYNREAKDFIGDDAEHYNAVRDTLDVWFDSGTTHYAVLREREELQDPADLYLEGSDQHRGWFQSSLLTSIAINERAPYKGLLTHGFVVDEKGRKMSKSLGNIITPQDIIKDMGADGLRFWIASADYRYEMTAGKEIFSRASDGYRRIRNTLRFLLANLNGFKPSTDALPVDQLIALDQYILQRAAEVQKTIQQAYEDMNFHIVTSALTNFCINDLGGFYLDIIKDRQYTTKADSQARHSAQTALYHLVQAFVRWMAPILSFTAQEAWPLIPEQSEKYVFTAEWYEIPVASEANMLAEAEWQTLIAVKSAVNKFIEAARTAKTVGSNLSAKVELWASDELKAVMDKLGDELRFVLITSQVIVNGFDAAQGEASDLEGLNVKVSAADGEKCVRCWHVLPDVNTHSAHPGLCSRCIINLPTGQGEERKYA